jgi:hypothetical protein
LKIHQLLWRFEYFGDNAFGQNVKYRPLYEYCKDREEETYKRNEPIEYPSAEVLGLAQELWKDYDIKETLRCAAEIQLQDTSD